MRFSNLKINKTDVKRLKYRLGTTTHAQAVRVAVALCANMNMADFNQFIAVYHKQAVDHVEKNSKTVENNHRSKIKDKGGLDTIILCKILGYTLTETSELFDVPITNVHEFLKARGLKWSTLITNEDKLLYSGKHGTITTTGGDYKPPKKKKKQYKKKKYKKKTRKKDRHRKYYHVTKHRDKRCKQGFQYRYTYTKNGKKHHIEAVDIKELERLVKLNGLKWEKLPLYDGEFDKNDDGYDEYLKWLKENEVVE